MGALHEGHLSLVRLARGPRAASSPACSSTQPNSGRARISAAYPRDEARDVALLAAAGCDLLYAPAAGEIYPPGFSTRHGRGVRRPWRALRPHHFAGVATVVAKLLIQCAPDVAVFGEKDYQQLQVIRRLAAGSGPAGGDHRRADRPRRDGLALSSRNAYLTPDQRAVAGALPRLANAAVVSQARRRRRSRRGGRAPSLTAGFERRLFRGPCRADDLSRLGPGPVGGPARILAAARLGETRLIDNSRSTAESTHQAPISLSRRASSRGMSSPRPPRRDRPARPWAPGSASPGTPAAGSAR